MTSSAGSYIKELVHGDFVRTVPSVKTILDTETDILALGRGAFLSYPFLKLKKRVYTLKEQCYEKQGVYSYEMLI